MSPVLPFVEIAPGIGAGTPAPPRWQPIDQASIVIIVGVTGVGKSTMLGKVAKMELTYTLLPDRRQLTDRLIIATLQAVEGRASTPVTDRSQRFAYTRRYREEHPGGMSEALAQLYINPARVGAYLLFDGLRGVDEVAHAVVALPHAYFVVLHAPDGVRVQRLLIRNDSFDRVTTPAAAGAIPVGHAFADLGLREAETLFSADEQAALLALVEQGEVTTDDLRAKVQIVLEERRNYDPYAAIDLLQTKAAARTLVIDTTKQWPDQVARMIVAQLQAWGLGN